ncbi:hypothetical protein GCWU000341_02188 [Oribacterium sp. oral taxon 078 str. F0262]|nr:hypothetical protein GCWU000341_02188 [Oribacterium sp. oral taxon 078 str. F0262]
MIQDISELFFRSDEASFIVDICLSFSSRFLPLAFTGFARVAFARSSMSFPMCWPESCRLRAGCLHPGFDASASSRISQRVNRGFEGHGRGGL